MLFVLVILLTIASVALRITISGLELATAVAVRSDRLARGMIDKMSYKEPSPEGRVVGKTVRKVAKLNVIALKSMLKTVKFIVDRIRDGLLALSAFSAVMCIVIFLLLASAASGFMVLYCGTDDNGALVFNDSVSGNLADSTSKSKSTSGNSTSENAAEKGKLRKDFKEFAINQKPELPCGCEITSLTMVLNYYDIEADKCDLADNYLPKGNIGSTDYNKAFIGNPRDSSSYGCYAPVIKTTANGYLKAKNSKIRATDISGKEFKELLPYVDDGTPVIIWGTIGCKPGSYTTTWVVDGNEIKWYAPEHCMVLVGYTSKKVFVADPLEGKIVGYERTTFVERYKSLGKQAVVLQEKE